MLGELLGEVGAGEWHLRNKAHPDQGHPAGVYNGEVPSGCRGLENLESPRARGGRPRVGDSAFSGDEKGSVAVYDLQVGSSADNCW